MAEIKNTFYLSHRDSKQHHFHQQSFTNTYQSKSNQYENHHLQVQKLSQLVSGRVIFLAILYTQLGEL